MTDYDDVIDFVQIARDVTTCAPVTILILDTENVPAQDLSPDLARAVARKLNALANEFEQHKPLRRSQSVASALRALDD